MTSLEEGKLLLKKLLDEAIPVLAFLSAADGSSAKLSGFVDSCTNEVGIVIAAKKGAPAESANLRLAVRTGGLECFFGDERELDPDPLQEIQAHATCLRDLRMARISPEELKQKLDRHEPVTTACDRSWWPNSCPA